MGYGVAYIATTATKIVDDNCKRKILWMTNSSANSAVGIGPDANITSSNAGTILYQYQGWEVKKDYGDYKGPVYGVAIDATGAKIWYWEVEASL